MTAIDDRFGRRARKLRISITDRCPMRCVYCMPEGPENGWLPRDSLLTYEEIVRVARVAKSLGVDAVRLTGGEPLVRKSVAALVGALKQDAGIERLSMTTNGIYLAEQVNGLADAGLDGVTVSLDSLDRDRMKEMTGGDWLPQVLRGIEALAVSSIRSRKLNTVAVRGMNDHELAALAEFAWSWGAEPRYIEFMPFGSKWGRERIVPREEIVATLAQAFGAVEPVDVEAGSTSRSYRVLETGKTFGVIPTVSEPLCSECDRIRLTADGRMLGCLFATGGPSVRDVMRQADGGRDADIVAVLQRTYKERGIGYMEEIHRRAPAAPVEVYSTMHQVGG